MASCVGAGLLDPPVGDGADGAGCGGKDGAGAGATLGGGVFGGGGDDVGGGGEGGGGGLGGAFMICPASVLVCARSAAGRGTYPAGSDACPCPAAKVSNAEIAATFSAVGGFFVVRAPCGMAA